MKNTQIKEVAQVFGNVAKKIAESAVHAAVFAFVSKKVTSFMTKQEEKTAAKDKIRIEDTEGTKTGG